MIELLLTVIILALIIAGMAIGAILQNKPITGSCGGVGAALGEENYSCDICGGDPNKCDEQDDLTLAYDASSEDKQQ
jgi:uncharacterized protein